MATNVRRFGSGPSRFGTFGNTEVGLDKLTQGGRGGPGFGFGSGRIAGTTGLKGVVEWNPGPELLERAVHEAGIRLIKNVDHVMTKGAQFIRDQAQSLARRQYEVQTPRAAPGLSAARGSPAGFAGGVAPKGSFRITLYHGPRTVSQDDHKFAYGKALEAQQNVVRTRDGSTIKQFGHKTEVIMPTIIRFGPQVIGQLDLCLVKNVPGGGAVHAELSALKTNRESLETVRMFINNRKLK